MKIPLYWVDAFTDRVFRGNPAAVCPLERWLDDALLQSMAFEHGLSETAYVVPLDDGRFHIRWFTPEKEVDLCGHATLATAHVLGKERVVFSSKSGDLTVTCEGDELALLFPSRPLEKHDADLADALGVAPLEVYRGGSLYMAVLASDAVVTRLAPRMERIAALDERAVIVTAPGDESDFVSRFFAPKFGIPEDPVTGSAHCSLIPYWSKRLGKKQLTAIQRSARGGRLTCEDRGEKVIIAGRAVVYMTAAIELP
jgi:PhzF family phenazine biosynthesis protein